MELCVDCGAKYFIFIVDLSQSQNALIHKLCWIDTLIQAFFNVNQNDGIGVLNIARGRGSYLLIN